MKENGLVGQILQRPYLVYSLMVLFVIFGVIGYDKMDRKLFPESNYPQIAVVVMQPSASAKTMAANVAVPIEEELYTLEEVRRVFSTTIDEVSVVSVEFEYTKDLSMAASDVTNALNKIRYKLPVEIQEPQINQVSGATPPVVVIGVSSDTLSLPDIRQLAENELRHDLLKVPGVANIDIFGGYAKEIQIILDKNRLDQYGLSLGKVLATLKSNDKDYAVGFITNENNRYILKSPGREETIHDLRSINLSPDITLGDVSKIYFGHYENSASYYGNSKKAIAMSVQRGYEDDVVGTVTGVEEHLKKLEKKYPALAMEVTDTQKDTIVLSIENMFGSLSDAIIMSMFVVFFFLASFRQVAIVILTIPVVYLGTISLMWLVGLDFNVITLTGIILALGLLLDDTVVVMENIERHYKEGGKNIRNSVFKGTKEIMFADLSGTITTMVALFPIMYIGGFPETMFRPLVTTLLLALTASYFVSISLVPLLSMKILTIEWPWLIKAERFFEKITTVVMDQIQGFFTNSVKLALKSKIVGISYVAVFLLLFVISAKLVMPVVGSELMPPMDTGAIKVTIMTEPNLPIEASEDIIEQVDKLLRENGKVLYLSSQIGSEPGVLSIGSGSSIDNILIIATYINRHEREDSIYEIEHRLRPLIAKIENVKRFEVKDTGSDVLSSVRSSIDVMLTSSSFADLDKAGKLVEQALYKTQGIISVMRTWDMDKAVYNLEIDQARAAFYGLNSKDINGQLQGVLRGAMVATFPLQNSLDLGVRVWLPQEQRNNFNILQATLIDTPKGKIPLAAIASFSTELEPGSITREGLNYTLNVYGSRETAAVTQIMDSFNDAFDPSVLPPSVTMEQTGDAKAAGISSSRMGSGIVYAITLIFFTLIAMFNSIKVSMMITFSIPLIIIGAAWADLFMGYHMSMPGMMGFILLSGIIVNNAILLIHFAIEKMQEGMNKTEAMMESIMLRTRPVVMTATAVAVGMLPVAQGNAIGLERMAPLGAVAIGGLIVGTFLTLLFIPLIFIKVTNDSDIEKVE